MIAALDKYATLIKLVAIGLLIGALLWMRGDLNKAKGELGLARAEVSQLRSANEQNRRVIEGFSQQRIDNDAIAAAVAQRLDANQAHTEQTRQAIRTANNDPTVRDWALMPLPELIKRLLNDQVTASDGIPPPAR